MPPPLANGRYTLRRVLGAGGMATVYWGHDDMLQVDRAIKVLAPAMARNEKVRTRFLAEARTMARLRHKNIVAVFDVGMDDGAPFIVMEVVNGGSLMDLLERKGAFAPRVAAQLMVGLLRGLEVAHENGVIHRDVKPHNVLVTKDGIPKLTDFGIARVEEQGRSLTRTGAVMGTLAYMAPEQRRSAKSIDVRADVYAAGATLYALASGDDPFDLHATESHSELLGALPNALADIIKKSCRYEPDGRYDSANTMAEAILAIIEDLPGEEGVAADGGIILDDADIACWDVGEDSLLVDGPSDSSGTFVLGNATSDLLDGQSSQSNETVELKPFTLAKSDDDTLHRKPTRGKAFGRVIGVSMLVLIAVAGVWVGKSVLISDSDQTESLDASATEATEIPAEADQLMDAVEVKDADAGEEADKQADAVVVEGEEPAQPENDNVENEEAIKASPSNEVPAPVKASSKKRTRSSNSRSRTSASSSQKSTPASTGTEATPAVDPVATEAAAVATSTAASPAVINSRPWSNLTLDGVAKGRVGWKGSLTPGSHTVSLTTQDGRTHTETISVTADNRVTYCWDFNVGNHCSRR